ncbi:hypothetical protein FI667_g5319, partial [Globisporangium splendens]
MGNDGGVIAVKRKFMRHGNTKARGEKVDQEALRVQKAQTCAISEEPLREPIVVCELGNLYNKQALLEHLLAKTMPEKFQHITSLKDVVTCRFSKQNTDSTSNNGASLFYCPVSMLEFNGKQPFVVVSTCGCVVSERSLKEVQTKECLVCGESMDGAKLIALFQSDENYELKQKEILERKTREKLLKKESKKNKSSKKSTADSDGATAAAAGAEDDNETTKKTKKDKKRKAESQHSSAAHVPASKIVKDATSAIQKEKEKSAVFASLFSKDKSEKKSANDLLMTVGGMRYTLS